MAKRIFPRRDEVYTFEQIVHELDLRDSACLTFWENEVCQNIQDSHINEHDMLKLPRWAESRWVFTMETDEWIPIFRFAKDNEVSIDELVDKEPYVDPFAKEAGVLWCIPKGTDHEQYYRIVTEGCDEPYITSGNDDRYPVPEFDENGKSERYHIARRNPGCCDNCKAKVEQRFTYRDFEEGSGAQPREVCRPCKDAYQKYLHESWG